MRESFEAQARASLGVCRNVALSCALLAALGACGTSGTSGTRDGGSDTGSSDASGEAAITAEAGSEAAVDVSAAEVGAEPAATDGGAGDAGALDVSDANDVDSSTPPDVTDVLVADAGPDAGPDVVAADAAEAGLVCGAGETDCAGRCVPVQSDSFNCGMCGRACPAGQSCAAGVCACAAGSETCGGVCVATQSDPMNCGMCGRACPSAQRCGAGACGCTAGSLACGDRCVQADSDEMNCGMCGRACGMGQSCAGGMCVCPMGQTACGMGAAATCVNTQTDGANCGACGTVCATGQSCVAGACACPTGQSACGTGAALRCVNRQTDNDNCGACGTSCAGGSSCVAGVCACPTGETRCGMGATAACTNTTTDTSNCGACGTACPAGQLCNGGVCQLTCTAPRVRCSAGSSMSCTDPQSDDQNCGTCGTVCGTVPNSNGGLCSGGSCRPICESGFANCDTMYANGCEANTTNDTSNCGACGSRCPTAAPNASSVACTGGACRAVCAADTPALRPRDCNAMAADGCEVNLLTDANNCGACGTVCAAGVMCVGGLCTPRSCNDLHVAAPTLPSGEYDIDPDGPGGAAAMRVYCDMATDGGGWTLAAYATVDNNGYSYCSRTTRRNFYNLNTGGGVYQGGNRVDSASLPAVPLAQRSTEIMFARSSTIGFSGEIRGMTAASKFSLPSPSTTNFLNPTPFTTGIPRGTCVPVTITVVVGPAVTNRTRYTFSNAVGVAWGDAYPIGYGAHPVQNCAAIGEGVGPMFANEYSGSFNRGYAPNGYCGSPGPNLEQGRYYHHGWWDADSQRNIGTASIWLR